MSKIVSGNFTHDVKRLFGWAYKKGSEKIKSRAKNKKGKGFFRRVAEAMRR